jgi:hypothetical protein
MSLNIIYLPESIIEGSMNLNIKNDIIVNYKLNTGYSIDNNLCILSIVEENYRLLLPLNIRYENFIEVYYNISDLTPEIFICGIENSEIKNIDDEILKEFQKKVELDIQLYSEIDYNNHYINIDEFSFNLYYGRLTRCYAVPEIYYNDPQNSPFKIYVLFCSNVLIINTEDNNRFLFSRKWDIISGNIFMGILTVFDNFLHFDTNFQ